MDLAYDHVQEAVIDQPESSKSPTTSGTTTNNNVNLNAEFNEAYKAISNSPWGMKFGGWLGETEQEKGLMERLKKNAAKRIEEIEKAEAKADEYLLKWGTTIGNFLKEAVTVAPPEGEEFADEASNSNPNSEPSILFDQGTSSGEGEGKRQIYTTRLDAQLHLLHTSHDLFLTNPAIPSFTNWSNSFSAEKRTERIASDLGTYPELRSTMEKLVPAEVKYVDFFKRYYFLRTELDAEEQKRKELLRGALEEEEVGWDSDAEGRRVGMGLKRKRRKRKRRMLALRRGCRLGIKRRRRHYRRPRSRTPLLMCRARRIVIQVMIL
ncbi:hypothetical protein BGX38DRAFT_413267 [Terfezia claveryi]|nr:hypothetical protein BGX38DRAFT_413267 [Terfezia claveryi]